MGGLQCLVTPEMINKLVISVIRVRKFFISFFLLFFFIAKFKAGDARSHFIGLMAHAIAGAFSATSVDSVEDERAFFGNQWYQMPY